MKHIKLFESFTDDYKQLIDTYITKINDCMLYLSDDYDVNIVSYIMKNSIVFESLVNIDMSDIDFDNLIEKFKSSLDKIEFELNNVTFSIEIYHNDKYIFMCKDISNFFNRLNYIRKFEYRGNLQVKILIIPYNY